MRHRLATLPILLFICFFGSAQGTVRTPDGLDQTVVTHTAYTVSFNSGLRIPNYVCYILHPEDITTEGVSRAGEEFLPDPDIPGCPESREYSRSGYDRGHMMPAADNKTSGKRMSESFYLSNICPQNHKLNEGPWCDLEKQIRFWCKHYYKTDIYIVCGPLMDDNPRRLTSGIAVPAGFWKVICRYDDRNRRWKATGFIFRNDDDPTPYQDRQVAVDTVELMTGFDFFSDLDRKAQDAAEMANERLSWKM